MTVQFPAIAQGKIGRFLVFSDKDLISQSLIRNGEWEPFITWLIDAFIKMREGTILDIGANIGGTCVPIALAHPTRRVIAIEAQRRVYNLLCGNIALNSLDNLYAIHAAAVDHDMDGQQIEMSIPDYGVEANIGAASLDPRVDMVKTKTGTEFVGALAIDTLALDALAVVKIDVEGFERQVLAGMKETLIRCGRPPIIYECWRKGKYDWVEAEKKAIQDFLEEIGYEVSYVEAVTLALAQSKDAKRVIKVSSTPDGANRHRLHTEFVDR